MKSCPRSCHKLSLTFRILGVFLTSLFVTSAIAADPIRLLPSNPHYFEFRGKPTALVTSAEHYGAVVNLDFNDKLYLATLAEDHLNYTRIFTGTYIEPVGAFGIERNTLAPKPLRFSAPWKRSDQPGYAGGGPKFDLTQWDPDYLKRLKAFLTEAGRLGVVVELTFFCSTYGNAQWSVSPFNPTNNINGTDCTDWKKLNTLDNGNVLRHQENLVRYLVRELSAFDNLFYEIQNEPWADHHEWGEVINPYLVKSTNFPNVVEITTATARDWQRWVTEWIIATEQSLTPAKPHLIAENISNFRQSVTELIPGVGLLHFHYAYPEAARWNYGWPVVIGCDETGFAGTGDAVYRRQAWEFMMSGGGLFNHLDYSFSVGFEEGTDRQEKSPGGGGKILRHQFGHLSRFLHRFPLSEMRPQPTRIIHAPGLVVYTLGTVKGTTAAYLRGDGPSELQLDLPKGDYVVTWIDPISGQTPARSPLKVSSELSRLRTPSFHDEMAVAIELTESP